jgi:hypothetical protein
MEASSGYLISWIIYLVAVVAAQGLLWWMLRKTQLPDFKMVLQFLLFAILITPATLNDNSSYWVPAFMAAFLGGLDAGFDAAIPRLWSIVAVFIGLLCISLLVRLYRKKRKGSTTSSKPSKTAAKEITE